MRHKHKSLLLLALAALLAAPAFADDALSVVVDPLTGVALDGLDPVSYFTAPAPLAGKPDFEYDWQGVPWYFANAADRDIFIRSPATYAPQFGGHAAMSLSRGFLSDGNPQIYTVMAGRLYLFYSTANRDAFLMSPGRAVADARQAWSALGHPETAVAGAAVPSGPSTPPAAATTTAASGMTMAGATAAAIVAPALSATPTP